MNLSHNVTSDNGASEFYTFIGVGAFTWISNLCVLVAIVTTQLKRKKEYILLGGFAAADMLNGFAYFCGGARRLVLYMSDSLDTNIAPFECMLYPDINLFYITETVVPCFTLFISIERLIAMVSIDLYLRASVKEAVIVLVFVYVYGCVDCGVAWILSYTYSYNYEELLPMVRKICYDGMPVSPTSNYYRFKVSQVVILGCISIVIYFMAIAEMYLRKSNGSSAIARAQCERQKKVTKTVAMVMLLTFAFQVCPVLYQMCAMYEVCDGGNDTLVAFVWTAYCWNSGLNVFIYAWKMGDMRRALMKRFLCCVVPHSPGNVAPLNSQARH